MVDVRRIVVGLEAGGVVTGIDENYVAVQPATLRHALVRDLFFSGPAPLDYRPLIQTVRNLAGVADTLVGVRTIGGEVPADLLWDVLNSADSVRAWVQFAWLGRTEVTRLLREKPQMLPQIALPALYRTPELMIGRFLDQSIGDSRNIASYADHPLRQIQDWVAAARPGSGQPLERRRNCCTPWRLG